MSDFLWIIILGFVVVDFVGAAVMSNAYSKKGYSDSSGVFSLCLLFGILGYLYVIAVPNVNDAHYCKHTAELLEQLVLQKNNASGKSEKNDNLADLDLEKKKLAEELRIQEELKRKEEAEKMAKENERKRRIDEYWNQHSQEYDALILKKKSAEEKMSKMGIFATKEREMLNEIIEQIDNELTKDR